MPVNEVARAHVLRPIWRTIPETARRLCGRIETVLDVAELNELRPQATRGGEAASADALLTPLGARHRLQCVRSSHDGRRACSPICSRLTR